MYHVIAVYRKELIPHYKGNRFIEALPRSLSDEEWADFLTALPEFDPAQRAWPLDQRLKMIARLMDFMAPLERTIRLALALDTMIRDGYVGREPRTPEYIATLQRLYEAKQAGQILPSARSAPKNFSQRSSSFVGVSGIGKTTAMLRIFSWYDSAIYHPDLSIIQIPWLHIEAPPDGLSVKELGMTIIRRITEICPDAVPNQLKFGYRPTEAHIMNQAIRLMHLCNVGCLIIDDCQRLKFSGKGKKALLNLLIATSNELGIPVLFVGTSASIKLLGLDASSARRSSGGGFPPWNVLHATHDFEFKNRGEWEHFIHAFWPLQWLKNSTPLNREFSEVLYFYSQGLIDIALKLFFSVQIEAIFDGSEEITEQEIKKSWTNNFMIIDPMITAFREGDQKALEQYEDIVPVVTFNSLLKNISARYHVVRDPLLSLRPGDQHFADTVAKELVDRGMDVEDAAQIAEQLETQRTAKNTRESNKKVHAKVSVQTRTPKRTKTAEPKVTLPDMPPDDFRWAVRAAKEEGCSIFSKLQSMGAVFDFSASLEE
ncbi:AAA family ATPase [Paraburkholderia bannensis]|uniref:AAA family ATPase n=1 Tax=Paraburkholderia bannensis TaxID=765414 RepID=UPI002AB63566|nr:AAA family ATPase [Paraburkholderia bannensis]